MSSFNNTASNIPAITESLLAEASDYVDSTGAIAKDKDHIIGELVTHIKKQHRIICSLNAKINPTEQDQLAKIDSLADYIENEIPYESLNAQKKDKLISRLATHISSKQQQLKNSVSKLSTALQSTPQPKSRKLKNTSAEAGLSALTENERQRIETEIKAELITQIKDDIRRELHAEILAKLDLDIDLPQTSAKRDAVHIVKPENKPAETSSKNTAKTASGKVTVKPQAKRPLTRENAQAPETVTARQKTVEPTKTPPARQAVPAKEARNDRRADAKRPAPAQEQRQNAAKPKPQIEAKVAPAASKTTKATKPSQVEVSPLKGLKTGALLSELEALEKQKSESIEHIEPSQPSGTHRSINDSTAWPATSATVDEDDEDDENDEIDNEVLFSLTEKLNTHNKPAIVDHNAPAVIEVTRYHRGEIKDLQHVAVGSHYYARVGDKAVKIASNSSNNRCQFYYSKRFFSGAIGDQNCKTSEGKNLAPLRADNPKKLIRYTLPTDKVVFLKAGNDEYRLRSVPTTISPKIPEKQQQQGKRFKHFLQYSAIFHLVMIVAASLIYTLTHETSKQEDEPRFAQVDLSEMNKPVPTPEPKPKPPAESKKPQAPTPEPKPVAKPKVTKKLAAPKPKHKNAGGGSEQGGNLKKRDVKSSGLLAALGTKSGKKPGSKQALATISSLDAVNSLDQKSATLKVGGLAAKVQGARIEVASGELIDTKGSTSVLRSGGASGNGQVAALESGVTGNREVRGQVSATLSRKVKIQGGLSRDEVKRVIDAHMDEVVYCYEKTLLSSPGLSGKAVFEWKVLLSGRVGEVNIKSSSLRSNQIHSCIKSAIKTWQFPQPTGTAVFVSFPFIFDSVEF